MTDTALIAAIFAVVFSIAAVSFYIFSKNVPMMKHLLTATALAVICRGLWTHDWRTILAGLSVAVIWPLISAEVTHVCTCSKNARCLNCVERDGLTKGPKP